MPHFMAAIAYGKGVIAAEQYFGRINADTFSFLVHENFASMFKKCPNLRRKFFLQDGCSLQISCKSRFAWDERGARNFSIPARVPDLNPMEKFFHTLIKKLHLVALEMKIECEDFEESSALVKENTGECTS